MLVRHFAEISRKQSFLLQPCAFVILASTLLFGLPAAAEVSFSAEAKTSGDTLNCATLSGDFNNDGILDIVSINDSTISFYRGLGKGKFAAPVNSSFSGPVTSAAVADLNGDGKLDIAYLQGGIKTLLGNGDGTFTAGPTINLSANAFGIVLADFNGDHIPDMALITCQPEQSCGVPVYLGQGNGNFTLSATLNPTGVSNIAVGDFNGDGYQDIVIAETDDVAVYLGEGNGQFQTPITVSQQSAKTLAVGDFYDDRIQSIAVENVVNGKPGQKVYVDTVRYSNGQLLSTKPQYVAEAGGLIGFSLDHGDLNGDFKDDLVLSGSYSTAQSSKGIPLNGYMLGTGKGTFDSMVTLPSRGNSDGLGFVRDLNLDSRHDVGIGWSDDYPKPSGILVLLNQNATPNCDPPPANVLGVNVCAPMSGETISPTYTFKAAGNAFNGICKRMELWIDGTKIGENLEDQLKIRTTLSAGTHTATFIAVDTFDNIYKEPVTFTVR
ncbi:MAG: VCBS repeat-containing protein [Terriglobales bacterium]